MSFGFSASDAVLFGQLAWKTFQNSRKACGEHDELTREASSLHVVIDRLEKEVSKPESPINRPGDRCKEELQAIVRGCETVLKLLNRVLEKYNTLSEKERSVKKLWQSVRFGNGELADIRDLREKLTYYTSALSLFVNMVSMGSMGRVEQKMETAGEDIREMRIAVNGITAHLLSASNREGSVLTTYADDDKAVWKDFRKELIEEGFSSAIIRKHKRLIKAYIKELGDRGLFDDEDSYDSNNFSGTASTRTDDPSASSELKSLPKPTSIKMSKLESRVSRNDRFKATENGVEPPPNDPEPPSNDAEPPLNNVEPTLNNTEPPPNDASITSYSDTVLTARSPGTRLLEAFFKGSHVDPAGCKEIVFSSYGCAEIPCNNSGRFVVRYESLLLRKGQYSSKDALLLSARFRARFQVLVECLPHIWIFRARKDIDLIRTHVKRTTRIGEDWEVIVGLLSRALSLLESFYRISSYYLLLGIPALGSSFALGRLFSTRLETLMNSEWQLKHAKLGGSMDSGCLSSYKQEIPVTKWIHQFDTKIGAAAARLTNASAKAAEMIQNSDYNGMRSIALSFTDTSASESRAQKS